MTEYFLLKMCIQNPQLQLTKSFSRPGVAMTISEKDYLWKSLQITNEVVNFNDFFLAKPEKKITKKN